MAVATKRVKMHTSRKTLSQDLLNELTRPRLQFVPQWQGSIQGWAVKFCIRNAWKTMPHMDPEDLLQEAYILFLHVKDKYPEVISPSHFMRLFQMTLNNFVIDMAQGRTRRQKNERKAAEMELERQGPTRSYHEELLDDADVKMMLEEAPPVVRKLVKAMRGHEEEAYERVGGRRETTSQRLARIASLDPEVDWAGIICNWINGAKWPTTM